MHLGIPNAGEGRLLPAKSICIRWDFFGGRTSDGTAGWPRSAVLPRHAARKPPTIFHDDFINDIRVSHRAFVCVSGTCKRLLLFAVCCSC